MRENLYLLTLLSSIANIDGERRKPYTSDIMLYLHMLRDFETITTLVVRLTLLISRDQMH